MLETPHSGRGICTDDCHMLGAWPGASFAQNRNWDWDWILCEHVRRPRSRRIHVVLQRLRSLQLNSRLRMATNSPTTDTVTVNVNTLSTALAAAIHQVAGSGSTRDRPGGSSQVPFSTVTEEPSGSGTTSNDQ